MCEKTHIPHAPTLLDNAADIRNGNVKQNLQPYLVMKQSDRKS